MTGILDVGGGMKCAYSAGLYDFFIDNSITFDYCLGVSAGSMNLFSYIAGERGRNIDIYRSSASGSEYLSISNLVHNGTYMNYEQVRNDYFSENGKYPFNYDKYRKSDVRFIVSATEAGTGNTDYYTKEDMGDDVTTYLSASCCLPIASRPILIDNKEYFDGGIAEPIPFSKAFEDGCDKLVVVLSSPVGVKHERLIGSNLLPAVLNDYPHIADAIENRHVIYNYCVKHLLEFEKKGKVLIFSPENTHGAMTLMKDTEAIDRLYDNGREDAQKSVDILEKMIEG